MLQCRYFTKKKIVLNHLHSVPNMEHLIHPKCNRSFNNNKIYIAEVNLFCLTYAIGLPSSMKLDKFVKWF